MTRIAGETAMSHHSLLWGLSLGLVLCANLAAAETPRASFGSALITGADNRITVSRVPVIDSAGKVTYRDVTVDFSVSDTGALTTGATTDDPSPELVTSGFRAGTYRDALGNTFALTGPSVIPGTTRTAWALVLTQGGPNNKNGISSMSWVTGPVADHPDQSSLAARGIRSDAYSWGLAGRTSAVPNFPFYEWDNGTVVGAVQAGDQLILHHFENLDDIADHSASLTRQ